MILSDPWFVFTYVGLEVNSKPVMYMRKNVFCLF